MTDNDILPDATPAAPDFVLVLKARDGVLMTKTIRAQADGSLQIGAYDNAYKFDAAECPVANLEELAKVLEHHGRFNNRAIVRGKLINGPKRRNIVRRAKPRTKDGRIIEATICDVPHRWVALDLDSVDVPAGIGDPFADVAATIDAVVRGYLPPEFHGVSCWWQFTSGMGIKPGIRFRLVFWLTAPLAIPQLKAWLGAKTPVPGTPKVDWPREWPIDLATFSTPVAITYIAPPVFAGKARDPVPVRSGVFGGDSAEVTPPMALIAERMCSRTAAAFIARPERRQTAAPKATGGAGGAGEGFEGALRCFGDGPGRGGFYQQMLTAIGRFYFEDPAGDPRVLAAALRVAIVTAPRDHKLHPNEYVRELLDEKMWPAIRAIQERELASAKALPPYWQQQQPLSRADASARCRGTIRGWLDAAAIDVYERNTILRLKARSERERRRHFDALAGDDIDDPFAEPPPSHIEARAQITRRHAATTRRLIRLLRQKTARMRGPQHVQGERVQLVAAAGLGKTSMVAQELGRLWQRLRHSVIWIAVPDLGLAEQLAGTLVAEGLTPTVVRGRGAPRPDGTGPMCALAEQVEQTARLGINVGAWCPNCSFRPECGDNGYLSQRTQAPGIYIVAHAYLTLPMAPVPRPQLLIIDESSWKQVVRPWDLPLDWLARPLPCLPQEAECRWSRLVAALKEAVIKPRLLAAVTAVLSLPDLEWMLAQATEAQNQLQAEGAALVQAYQQERQQSSRPVALAKRLDAIKDDLLCARGIKRLLRALLRELPLGRPIATAVRFQPDWRDPVTEKVRPALLIDWRASMNVAARVPVLQLDASGDLAIDRRIWGERLRQVRIPVERNANVVQVSNRTFSRQSVVGSDELDSDAQQLRRQLADFIASVKKRHGPTLVVSYKDIAEDLGAMTGADALHYNRLRGSNSAEHCRAAVIIGREQPLPAAERMARALWADDNEPILGSDSGASLFVGDTYRQTRRYRLRRGAAKTKVSVHPDPRAQLVLEQLREREIEQAVDRLRLIHNDARKHVYLLTSIPVDVTVDEVVTAKSLMGNSRIATAVRRLGLFVVAPRIMARLFPDLWPSAEAARSDMRRQSAQHVVKSQIMDLLGSDLLLCTFSGPNHKRVTAFVDGARYPDPQDALEKAIGVKLSDFSAIKGAAAAGDDAADECSQRRAPMADSALAQAVPTEGRATDARETLLRRAAQAVQDIVGALPAESRDGLFPDPLRLSTWLRD